ncbi:hypothetical protein PP707_06465 [Acetobacter pasteurianus]|nr:hypothetical protein [Acetobacter pasteurianus]
MLKKIRKYHKLLDHKLKLATATNDADKAGEDRKVEVEEEEEHKDEIGPFQSHDPYSENWVAEIGVDKDETLFQPQVQRLQSPLLLPPSLPTALSTALSSPPPPPLAFQQLHRRNYTNMIKQKLRKFFMTKKRYRKYLKNRIRVIAYDTSALLDYQDVAPARHVTTNLALPEFTHQCLRRIEKANLDVNIPLQQQHPFRCPITTSCKSSINTLFDKSDNEGNLLFRATGVMTAESAMSNG